MTTLEILTIPDPRLKHKSSIVDHFDSDLRTIIKNMYETLYSSGNGIGLAAPQVGIRKRIVVIDLKVNGESSPVTFINPKIKKFSEEKFINEEGCLSVPEYYADVERSKEVEVEWFNELGEKKKEIMTGLMSICIKHEIDHLDGILFIDYLSKIKKDMIIKKLTKFKKEKDKIVL